MTIDDQVKFAEAFRRLAQTFRLRIKPAELEALTTTYFKLLQGWTLDEVLAAGKTCLTTSRRFPQPVDWLAAMPVKTALAADLRWMTADEASAYLRAEALSYEDAPCDCLLCQGANVTRHPLRFVADFDAELARPERAFCPAKNSVVTTGHWAHGDELVRWYAAKARFESLKAALPIRVPRRVKLLPAPPLQLVAAVEREPGMEG